MTDKKKNPKRDELMMPILIFARERLVSEKSDVFNVKSTFNFIINELGLSKDILNVKYKSGQGKFDTNVRWAIQDLYEAKLMERVNRGYYKITNRGLDVLEENPRRINTKTLMNFREFREYKERTRKRNHVKNNEKPLIPFKKEEVDKELD